VLGSDGAAEFGQDVVERIGMLLDDALGVRVEESTLVVILSARHSQANLRARR
jgi:hypothetical protein